MNFQSDHSGKLNNYYIKEMGATRERTWIQLVSKFKDTWILTQLNKHDPPRFLGETGRRKSIQLYRVRGNLLTLKMHACSCVYICTLTFTFLFLACLKLAKWPANCDIRLIQIVASSCSLKIEKWLKSSQLAVRVWESLINM